MARRPEADKQFPMGELWFIHALRYHSLDMQIQRCVTILLPYDPDLRATLDAFQAVQRMLSPLVFNDGNPLTPLATQRAHYHAVKGRICSQMTISAIRCVCAAYLSAQSTLRP